MVHLSELQIEFISDEIKERGIQMPDLHEDLLDHICTAIEKRMDDGESFEAAYEQTIKLFGPGGLMQVQEQTLLILTQMNETMKKSALGFGLASTALLLAGMLFKFQHWPGAGMLLVTGNFFLVAVYLPILLIHKLRESEKKDHPMLILGFLGLLLFASGTTFTIMHWPYGRVILIGGFLILVLGFLPMFFLGRYKNSINKSITLTTAMLVLIGVIQVGQLLNLKNSSQYTFSISFMHEVLSNNLKSASNNEALLVGLEDNDKVQQVHAKANQVISDIERIKEKLITTLREDFNPKAEHFRLSQFDHIDNFDIPTRILVGNYEHPNTDEYSAAYVRAQIESYKLAVLDLYDEPMKSAVTKTFGLLFREKYLSVYGRTESWEQYFFYHCTLSSAMIFLTQLQLEVRQSENQALIYLKTHRETPQSPSAES